MMATRWYGFFLCAVLALAPSFATANGHGHMHEGDIELEVEDGRIVTHPGRAFESELGIDTNSDGMIDLWGMTESPGFDSEPGTFPVPSAVGFNLLEPLLLWTGSGYETTGPMGPTMKVAHSVLEAVTGEGFVPGFELGVHPDGDNAGRWHRHYDFSLVDNGAGLADGIYLLTMQMTSSDPGISPSQRFWIVFNYRMDEATHDAAFDWVETHLVPEPGLFALLGLGGVGLLRKRRGR